MSTGIWMVFGGVALGLFWAVGAYNRLSGLRDRVVQRHAEADRVLRTRRKAVLAWVAVAEQGDAAAPDSAPMGLAPTDASPGVPAAEAPCAGAADRAGLRPDARKVELVMHACAQAGAAGEQARRQPTRRGAMASLNMAEQVLERTLQEFLQHPSAVATPQALRRRAAWMACEVQLTVARQMLNRDIAGYNAAVRQFPARVLATLVGMRPTEPLRAGAELSPTVASAAGAALPGPDASAEASARADAVGPAGVSPAGAS